MFAGKSLSSLMSMDMHNDEKDDGRNWKVIRKFQQTIRRLSVLRIFARKLNIEFDIEQMELSKFYTMKDKI